MATLGGIFSFISEDHERLIGGIGLMNEREDRARPPQGGQRITIQWLRSIRDADCKYRFRYLCSRVADFNIPITIMLQDDG
jgi:hypothetical protein